MCLVEIFIQKINTVGKCAFCRNQRRCILSSCLTFSPCWPKKNLKSMALQGLWLYRGYEKNCSRDRLMGKQCGCH